MAVFHLYACSDGAFLATPDDPSTISGRPMIRGDMLTHEAVLKSASLGSTYLGMDHESRSFIACDVAAHLRNTSSPWRLHLQRF